MKFRFVPCFWHGGTLHRLSWDSEREREIKQHFLQSYISIPAYLPSPHPWLTPTIHLSSSTLFIIITFFSNIILVSRSFIAFNGILCIIYKYACFGYKYYFFVKHIKLWLLLVILFIKYGFIQLVSLLLNPARDSNLKLHLSLWSHCRGHNLSWW